MSRKKIILSIISLLAVFLFSGCGCKAPNPHKYNMNLEIWGFDDDDQNLRPIFENYQKINPNIKQMSYRKLEVSTYKKEIIDALAAGQGPDIFLIHNTWLPGFSDKIVPAPADVINEQRYKKNFVDVAADDFIAGGKIYAMPLSVDSLGLYYNKDLFNAAGITMPPADWDKFTQDVRMLTKINGSGEIVQSGASLGTNVANINRATDILNMLMLQSGYGLPVPGASQSADDSAGENVIEYYTQFARASSSNYSWNNKMHYSIDAFSEGNLAMMFNYSWHIATIKSKSPKLNFAIAPIPQFVGSAPVNYANYWAYAVSKNKIVANPANPTASVVSNETRQWEAWKFLSYLTTMAEAAPGTAANPAAYNPAVSYIKATGKPSARRDIIETQKNDPTLGAFAAGNLIAKSWWQKEPEAIEGALNELIDQINRGQANTHDALGTLTQRVRVLQGI